MEGKPFRRKSFVMSTLPLTQISKWSRCCGKSLSEHLTAKNCSSWQAIKANNRRYPRDVMSGFLADIHHGLSDLGASIAVRVVNNNVGTIRDRGDIREEPSRHHVDNHDHIRYDDDINIDHVNNVLTRPVRVKFKESVGHIPMERSFPLEPKKNKKAIVKKPIEWPADPEKKHQGQNADCGEYFTSIEEEELMDCEFRDDALHGRHVRKAH